MKVLCTGAESSGTRLLTRIVDTGEGIEAIHRSIPHEVHWDLSLVGEVDAAIFIARSWSAVAASQRNRRLVKSTEQAHDHIRAAYRTFFEWVTVPWWLVTYGQLV